MAKAASAHGPGTLVEKSNGKPEPLSFPKFTQHFIL